LLDASKTLGNLKYQVQAEALCLGLTKADGDKCDRCWHYSMHVGRSEKHALLCDRCDSIIDNDETDLVRGASSLTLPRFLLQKRGKLGGVVRGRGVFLYLQGLGPFRN